MARDRRRSKLSHADLIAELDADLLHAAGADSNSLALFYLAEVSATVAEARRRWLAANARGKKAVRILTKLKLPRDRYGRQLARAVSQLRQRLEAAVGS